MRIPNSKECVNKGLGMYDIPTHIGCDTSDRSTVETRIGSFDSDELNDDGTHSEGRIEITVEVDNSFIWLDLEDILVFAKKYCAGIYERVAIECQTDTK